MVAIGACCGFSVLHRAVSRRNHL